MKIAVSNDQRFNFCILILVFYDLSGVPRTARDMDEFVTRRPPQQPQAFMLIGKFTQGFQEIEKRSGTTRAVWLQRGLCDPIQLAIVTDSSNSTKRLLDNFVLFALAVGAKFQCWYQNLHLVVAHEKLLN
ncbi:hypothetical protein RRG08_033700 [Elysia crispata]|uniref:Uncharacterized protein n=1 Tax=Elysia crispata TaxID=231223 RepID=A0AAE1A8T7_9GAST|nr:hypothetical protein RRG08_033700 [Elysia crispata]